MKILNLCVALVFAVSLCLTAGTENSFAASKETSSAVEKTTKSAKSKASTTKKSAKDTAKKATKPININTADKKMLAQLPGVGPKTADAIIKYRKANGKFKSANDLLNVKGIGEKTLKKMKPLLKF